MHSNRDPEEPQDPIEDDDLIGAEEDADEADEDEEDEEEEDEEEEEEEVEEEDEDMVDDEDDEDDEDEDEDGAVEEDADGVATVARQEPTGEVGSPGDTVSRVRDRVGLGRGREATTTWEGGVDETAERRDQEGVPGRRA